MRFNRIFVCASISASASVILLMLGVTPTNAHEPEEHAHHVAHIDHDVETQVKPWTHLNINDGPATFRFAIVSDRTGGCRPGVFRDAMKKLNLLQPEFVISVGDLIQGYTDDADQLMAEWDELRRMTESLEMPFFYVPGNHDISNDTMTRIWEQLFGRTFYSFTYRDVLFLVLHTEDAKGGGSRVGLSPRQVAWAKATLAKHADVKWTLVFMHRPLWLYNEWAIARAETPDDADLTGFEQIEAALADRNYTAYAGHFHRYTKYERNDRRYYVLATTGGGSQLTGPQHGYFDHVVWMTMTPTGPRMANLLLSGIHGEGVYTEAHRKFADGPVASLVTDGPNDVPNEDVGVTRFGFDLNWPNPYDKPAKGAITWDVPKGSPWKIEPAKTDFVIEPNAKRVAHFNVTFASEDPRAVFPLPEAHVDAQIEGLLRLAPRVGLPFDVDAHLAKHRPTLDITPTQLQPAIDGQLNDVIWQTKPNLTDKTLKTVHGESPVATDMWITYDAEHLYVAARCHQDDLAEATITEHDDRVWRDDAIELFIDTNADRRTYWQIAINHAGVVQDTRGRDASWNGEYNSAVGKVEGGWVVEMSIPWKTLETEPPRPAQKMGVLLMRAYKPPLAEGEEHRRRMLLQWPDAPALHNPARFGDIRLLGPSEDR